MFIYTYVYTYFTHAYIYLPTYIPMHIFYTRIHILTYIPTHAYIEAYRAGEDKWLKAIDDVAKHRLRY